MRHSLGVIDGYGVRFINLQSAQESYVAAHDVVEFRPADFPTYGKAQEPRRVPDRELQKARKSLVEATSGFLSRCRQEGLVSDANVAKALKSAGLAEELA